MRILTTLIMLGALLTGCAGQTPIRPNVILIFADDLGYGDLGAYGQELIATPELDALASSGIRMTQFYTAAPHCPPARSGLLQGRDTGHSYVRRAGEFPPDLDLLPERLKDAGYATAMFGKWGMGAHDGMTVTAGDPVDAGFDQFVGSMTHRDAHAYFLDSPSEPPGTPEQPFYDDLHQTLWTISNGTTVPLALSPDRYTHDEYVDRSLDYIASASPTTPFFMYLPFTIPHAELVVPEDQPGENLLGQYLDETGQSIFPEIPWLPDGGRYARHNLMPRATYAAMVSRLSRDVGRIVDAVIDAGLMDQTIIIFTSDNGPHDAGGIVSPVFFNSSGGLRDMKWQLTEGGVRVPGIFWGPGYFAGNRTIHTPAATWDLAATISDYASAAAPVDGNGLSLRSLLESDTAPDREFMYWETFNGPRRYSQAVRKGDFKALRRRGNTPVDVVELYHLGRDPTESTDLSGESAYCTVLNDLKLLMNSVRETPELNPNGQYDLVPLTVEPCCVGDVDLSGEVDFGDLNVLLKFWGQPHGTGDIDGNGTVDIGDLNEVLDAWTDAC